jgi:hypothetical protein
MANYKMKTRRHKKSRRASSKKRRQTKSRTKRYRRKTRKIFGGVKRTPNASELDGPPNVPRKNRRFGIEPINLFAAPLVQPPQQQVNNLFAYGAPVTPPPVAANNPQTPVFTPNNQGVQPQTPIQGNNLFAQGEVTPQGNLNNALDEAYMEAITTPQTMGVPSDLNIQPFGYDEQHNEIIDDYEEFPNIEDEYYETEEEEEI